MKHTWFAIGIRSGVCAVVAVIVNSFVLLGQVRHCWRAEVVGNVFFSSIDG
jgi:hypothetical protein